MRLTRRGWAVLILLGLALGFTTGNIVWTEDGYTTLTHTP